MFIIMSKNFYKEWYDYMIRVKLKQYLGSMVTIAAALFLFIVLFSTPVKADDNQAEEVNTTITLSNGGSVSRMTDGSYNTKTSFASGDSITVTGKDKIYSLYIKWDLVPDEWTLSYNGTSKTYGTNGFLHEYVEIPEGAETLTITFSSNEAICDLHAYSAGTASSDVQAWKTPCDKADILVFATHADDEILFLGGVLATYGGEQDLAVQVAYMCEFTSSAKIREHEKLDGLWESGIKHYPICGDFPDLYSTSLEAAKKQYIYDDVLSYTTSSIRRFKPLVVVTQDLNGEYGHGGHMLFSHAVAESVESSNDASYFPDSASKYGTWDVPKTYLHLYSDNKITMNLRLPLSRMGNRTSIEVQTSAYKKHISQQWCWFYVSDDYEYSCADFGLYRTTVGNDTGNDMLENITTYEEQEKIAKEKAEKESVEASIADEESSIAEEKSNTANYKKQSGKKIIIFAAVILVIIIVLFAAYRYYQLIQSRKRRRHHKRK